MPDISLIKSSVIYSLCIFFVVFIKLHSTGRKQTKVGRVTIFTFISQTKLLLNPVGDFVLERMTKRQVI